MNLNVGNQYRIDVKYTSTSIIKLIHLYGEYFCRVESVETGTQWDTMCTRLSEIEESKND